MDKFKKIAIIGYTGLVGSTIYYDINVSKYDSCDLYNSKNINTIVGKEYDCIFCAGANGSKWQANLFPDKDKASINMLLSYLAYTTTKKFVLISTIDVYPELNSKKSTYDEIDEGENHSYGKNRLYLENEIKKMFGDVVVVRLPGLFGYGLKKNIIYDFIFKKKIMMNPFSSYQWYYLGDLVDDLNLILKTDEKIVNLFPEPIKNFDLYDIFCGYIATQDVEKRILLDDALVSADYRVYSTISRVDLEKNEYNSKKTYMEGLKFWESNGEIKNKIYKYLDTMNCQRLCVSHLSWGGVIQDKDAMGAMHDHGVYYMEVAPNKLMNNFNSDPSMYKNLHFYSAQSLLYPSSVNMFKNPEEFKNTLKENILLLKDIVNSITNKSRIKVLVLGSPKNRIKGDLSNKEAQEIAAPIIKELSQFAAKCGMVVCIEPNSKHYMCDFITNTQEGIDFVEYVGEPNFKLHLDIGNMILEGENIIEKIYECAQKNILAHIHFSNKNLTHFGDVEEYRVHFRQIIEMSEYSGHISFEMCNQTFYDCVRSVRNCIR